MSANAKKNSRQPLELPRKDSAVEKIEVKKALPKPKAPPAKPVPVTTSDDVMSPKSSLLTQTSKPRPAAKPVSVAPATSVAPVEPAKLAKDTIYVDNDDEITAIIDKLEASKGSLVALVLPKRAQVLQSIVNMRLLKRSADEASKDLVLVTNESAVLPLAGVAGVNVAKNLQSKPYIPASPIPIKSAAGVAGAAAGLAAVAGADDDEKEATLDYHRSMGELAVDEEVDEPETIHLAEDAADISAAKGTAPASNKAVPPKDKKLKVPNFDRFRTLIILLVVGLVGLIVFVILAIKVLPKATISVQTTGTPVSANFTLNTSDKATTLDQAKMVIPATLQTKDQPSSQSVQATGTQNNGTKATGTVTMSATECSASLPVDVPAGSTVSANGLTYVTQDKTKFSNSGVNNGGCITYSSTSSTAITASSGGANYNAGGGTTFKVNGRSDVTATGSASGGTDNNVTVVAQADIDKAKAAVTSQSSDAFSKDFQKKLTDQGLYVIAPTLKISDPQVTATPGVGQPASTVSVNIKITYSVLTVKKDDLKTIVSAQLGKQIDTKKQQILDSDVLKNVVISVQNQTSPTVTALNITADASATPNIDVNSIKTQSAGKKSGEIHDLISGINGVKSVDVKMSPFWVSTVPAGKIKVNLQQVKTTTQTQSSNNAQP